MSAMANEAVPVLSPAAERALAAAKRSGGTIYSAPATSGLAPLCRWNIAQTLLRWGLATLVKVDARAQVHEYALTSAGYERARDRAPCGAEQCAPGGCSQRACWHKGKQ